jgi:hypothetical protein
MLKFKIYKKGAKRKFESEKNAQNNRKNNDLQLNLSKRNVFSGL